MKNIDNYVVVTRRAKADFRIQKKEDFKKIINHKSYFRLQESSAFRRLLHKIIGKRVGKTNIGAEELQAENKGYPKGFSHYQTYDPRWNRDYQKHIKRRAN